MSGNLTTLTESSLTLKMRVRRNSRNIDVVNVAPIFLYPGTSMWNEIINEQESFRSDIIRLPKSDALRIYLINPSTNLSSYDAFVCMRMTAKKCSSFNGAYEYWKWTRGPKDSKGTKFFTKKDFLKDLDRPAGIFEWLFPERII